MLRFFLGLSLFVSCAVPAYSRTVVFWQAGFPTCESKQISRSILEDGLSGMNPAFVDSRSLAASGSLIYEDLLVLPYGSAFPISAWPRIESFLKDGGKLVVLGGRPLRFPIAEGQTNCGPESDAYAAMLGIQSGYALPIQTNGKLHYVDGDALDEAMFRADRLFTLPGHIQGLVYLIDNAGERLAAPVVYSDHADIRNGDAMQGSRQVFLDFDPAPGFWESAPGTKLIREAARFASHGASRLRLELRYSVVRPSEPPDITLHFWNPGDQRRRLSGGTATVELLGADKAIDMIGIPLPSSFASAPVIFHDQLAPGFYRVRATLRFSDGGTESYTNGFWVADAAQVESGPRLSSTRETLTLDGKPFFPVGTNYFTTEGDGWDLWGPRNAAVWERDFSAMEARSITMVRTGVWWGNMRIVDPFTSEASERFLRNLEAYLLCAQRHHIVVNFTFFAFDPQTVLRYPGSESLLTGPGTNPYTGSSSIHEQQNYVLSIVQRFKGVPWLSWDLINEPSFANPRQIFRGNVPNGDSNEQSAWHEWLRLRYGTIETLAQAWAVTSSSLGGFDSVALPQIAQPADSSHMIYGGVERLRILDYNFFAQEKFRDWVGSMVSVVRSMGSTQLIDIGQDEGGVNDRVLDQFFADAGVSFTANHTYWNNDALLWDSFAAKVSGLPEIIGETGVPQVRTPSGELLNDEFAAAATLERKLALGFAVGASGAVQWDWSRDSELGMMRSDGTLKTWAGMMRGVSSFAKILAASASDPIVPQIAVVLPQSMQLSTFNADALLAQRNCVRALFHYARQNAYAVGEDRIDRLGDPKLIILPSPWVLEDHAWQTILGRVKNGAVLLISGRFDLNPHFQPTTRIADLGLDAESGPLSTRNVQLEYPGGKLNLVFSGNKTEFMQRLVFPDGNTWKELKVGRGTILISALPIEENDDLAAVGSVYRYASAEAGIEPVYGADGVDPGILIAPTRFTNATLYVFTSETMATGIHFLDDRSKREFSSSLAPGRAALLLVSKAGRILAAYNWGSKVE